MKTIPKITGSTLLISLLATGLAFGQGPGGGRPPHGPPPGGGQGGPGGGGPGGGGGQGGGEKPPLPPLVEALDQDSDESISSEEIKNASESLLTLDADNDGQLTEEEWGMKKPPGAAQNGGEKKRQRRKPNTPPLVKALDTDEDGTISETEIENASEALKQLDANNDGKLSRMEIRPSRRFRPDRDN